MIRNYFKITLRNLWRFKGYSFINIFGLAIGLTCALMIMLWVQDELSFDRFHQRSEQLYRVEQDQIYSGAAYHVNVTPWPCVPSWQEDIPEIENATRYGRCGSLAFRYGENAFIENDVNAVDPSFFEMFDFKLISGDRQSAISDPYAVVINEVVALKYFGAEDPLGKVLIVNDEYNLKVTGVLEKAPANSSIKPGILVTLDFAKDIGAYNEGWGSNSILSIVLLNEYADPTEVNAKLTEVVNNNREEPSLTKYMVAPLTGVHLQGYFGFSANGKAIERLYTFSIIAGFVLLIACINFMNLATARAAKRAREIGIRKVIGAHRSNLIYQFLGESLLLTILSVMVALLFVYLLLPTFNQISGKMMTSSVLLGRDFLLGLLAITLFTGLIAGSYPAFFLSAYRPIKVLKGNVSQGRSQVLRTALVILQFTLSVALIIATIVLQRQLNFSYSKDVGFDKQNVLTIPINAETQKGYEAFRLKLLQDPQVKSVAASSERPSMIGSNSGGADWEGKDPDQTIIVSMMSVDYDFVETMEINLAGGRTFSREFATDLANGDGGGAFLINETMAQIIGKDPIVNETFNFAGIEGPIVGVMKDWHFKSIREEIEPLAILIAPEYFFNILIKLVPGDEGKSLAAVESAWNEIYQGTPFEYQFLEDDYATLYRTDETIGSLIKYSALIGILIAYLGLFGLASFTAEQRKKEIGIRKVLGASVSQLVYLLTIQFTKWVLVSCAIAFPLAYYGLSQYLQNYAYRIDIGPAPFLIAGLFALLITWCTVSYQSVRAALTNPVESLKYE